MKSVCHYCKDKRLAEQSNNLCMDCLNAIVSQYAKLKPAQDHYLETLLMGLKPEPLEKLYIKALYMSHLDYCQRIIQFHEKGRDNGQPRIKTVKDRVSGDSRADADRGRGSPHIRHNTRHLSRNQTQKRNIISAHHKDQGAVSRG